MDRDVSSTPATRVALIGAGRMGRGIGRNALLKGFALRVFDVDSAAIATLPESGAQPAASPAAAIADAELIITCLPNVATVESTYLGPDGLIARAPAGARFIVMQVGDAATN